MKRRVFMKIVLGAGAAAAAPVAWLAQRAVPVRWVEAIRARHFPGTRKRLNESEIGKPAHWAG